MRGSQNHTFSGGATVQLHTCAAHLVGSPLQYVMSVQLSHDWSAHIHVRSTVVPSASSTPRYVWVLGRLNATISHAPVPSVTLRPDRAGADDVTHRMYMPCTDGWISRSCSLLSLPTSLSECQGAVAINKSTQPKYQGASYHSRVQNAMSHPSYGNPTTSVMLPTQLMQQLCPYFLVHHVLVPRHSSRCDSFIQRASTQAMRHFTLAWEDLMAKSMIQHLGAAISPFSKNTSHTHLAPVL